MMNPRWRLAWLRWLAVTAATLLLFNLFPQIDLAVSAALHDAAAAGLERFPLGQVAPVQALYHAVPWLGRLALILAMVLVLRRDTPPRPRRQATAVLLMLVLGLWLIGGLIMVFATIWPLPSSRLPHLRLPSARCASGGRMPSTSLPRGKTSPRM